MTTEQFDLIVLGAGSGGISTAIRAARHGARVAILEPRALGGTCVNVGCVPKKAMWLAAELAEAQRVARDVGFPLQTASLDWPAFIARRQAYINAIHVNYRERLEASGIELIVESGEFAAPDTLLAGRRTLRGKHVLIATGARSLWPNVPGAYLAIDSDGFFDLRACPERVAIVGGGYIAVELAGVLQSLGAWVDMYVRGPRLLRKFDHEIADALAGSMRARGITIHFNQKIAAVEEHGKQRRVVFADGRRCVPVDTLIWALGRIPNSDSSRLDVAGVALDSEGFVGVDEWQNTNIAGIHAVGDVTRAPALTPVAIAAGRHLADRLFGGRPDARLDFTNIPTIVFSHPALATVGLSESDARAAHGDTVKIYKASFRPMLNALAGHHERTSMKLVCAGDDERVVGLHMLGPAADEILQGFAVAIKMGARKADFDATIAIHPTSAEELVLM